MPVLCFRFEPPGSLLFASGRRIPLDSAGLIFIFGYGMVYQQETTKMFGGFGKTAQRRYQVRMGGGVLDFLLFFLLFVIERSPPVAPRPSLVFLHSKSARVCSFFSG